VDIKGYDATSAYRAVLEKDMLPGTKVTMHFMRTTAGFGATFLSRQAASSLPFSSAELPAILNHFSLEPNSFKAQSIAKTLHECETPAVDGETKYCATSLESMVEYTTSTLRSRNVLALSTVMSKEGAPRQQYTIAPSGVKKLIGKDFVACHARKYPYAIFYCHTVQGITAYQASMVGEDGTTMEAMAVCHTIIAGPDAQGYLSGLQYKPGAVPVCHFLPQDHIVWSRNK